MKRCAWAGEGLYREYHDLEWGVPLHDEHKLFEFLILEGVQAGLSWSTILNKRENYRKAFANFDPLKVARFSDAKLEKLLLEPGIVRNRLKIFSARRNAKAYLRLQKEFGSFDAYIWAWVDGKPIQNHWKTLKDLPAETELSRTISEDLKVRDFNFVGPTIVYAFMQAVGMVNDHTSDCFRHKECQVK